MIKIAKSLTVAALLAVTASVSAVLAESEAGLQAGSSSSTMNSAQAGRQSSNSATTQNNSQSTNQQNSHASTENTSHGSSEAVGGTLDQNRPGGVNRAYNSGAPISTASNTRGTAGSVRTPHSVTRTYRRRSHKKHGFNNAYMQQTIHQAARRQ